MSCTGKKKHQSKTEPEVNTNRKDRKKEQRRLNKKQEEERLAKRKKTAEGPLIYSGL